MYGQDPFRAPSRRKEIIRGVVDVDTPQEAVRIRHAEGRPDRIHCTGRNWQVREREPVSVYLDIQSSGTSGQSLDLKVLAQV